MTSGNKAVELEPGSDSALSGSARREQRVVLTKTNGTVLIFKKHVDYTTLLFNSNGVQFTLGSNESFKFIPWGVIDELSVYTT